MTKINKYVNDPIEDDILKWINHQKYVRIGSDVSVTELMQPPQLVHLRDRHRPTITKSELGNEIPSLVGQGTHSMLQKYLRNEALVSNKWLIERKMVAVINGIRVAGKFDALRELQHLYDIKVTRIWKYLYGGVIEFEQQLNMYDYMMYLDGYNIKSLTIMMVLLDWQAGKIWERGYPQSRIKIIPITKWKRKEQEDYLNDRVKIWTGAKKLKDKDLPKCTLSERWADEPTYKLYRDPSHKRATKTFKTDTGAKSYQAVCKQNDAKKWNKSIIKSVRGNPWKRCESWCEVSPYCEQYKNK